MQTSIEARDLCTVVWELRYKEVNSAAHMFLLHVPIGKNVTQCRTLRNAPSHFFPGTVGDYCDLFIENCECTFAVEPASDARSGDS